MRRYHVSFFSHMGCLIYLSFNLIVDIVDSGLLNIRGERLTGSSNRIIKWLMI